MTFESWLSKDVVADDNGLSAPITVILCSWTPISATTILLRDWFKTRSTMLQPLRPMQKTCWNKSWAQDMVYIIWYLESRVKPKKMELTMWSWPTSKATSGNDALLQTMPSRRNAWYISHDLYGDRLRSLTQRYMEAKHCVLSGRKFEAERFSKWGTGRLGTCISHRYELHLKSAIW